MSDISYPICYFDGLKPGIDEVQVTQKLAVLLKTTDDKARKLISATGSYA
jgi:hypothetical protein